MSKTTKQTMTAADTPGVPHMMQIEIRNWLAIRKRAARKIDPETAEVDWSYAQTLDPYGIHPELPEELQQVGREYFARSPGSDVWVWFGDLPRATRDALWEKHRDKLAFPAGLPLSWLEIEKTRTRYVIETHEHTGDFKEPQDLARIVFDCRMANDSAMMWSDKCRLTTRPLGERRV